ncbi:MAG: ribbon-helix-helix domain-containing protein [Deltaproteobacteria bacterium]|nr:ribbon-helix-helix domain-containing protein [Deltaproteobacteria bacterium]
MPRRKVATTVYLTPEQDSLLKVLHQQSNIPVARLVRQGVDMVLEHHGVLKANPGAQGSGSGGASK